MRVALLVMLLPAIVFAAQKYDHADRLVEDEFVSVYHDIKAVQIKSSAVSGTQTNDSAQAGRIGEYISSVVTTATDHATAGEFKDVTSVSLTVGDWDVSGAILGSLNGATATALYGVLSLFSGNTTTDHVFGDNSFMVIAPGATYHSTVVIPAWRVSIASTTTVYLKTRADYSAGTPQYVGRIVARRVR